MVRSVVDGERIVVTRHGEPRAVLLSLGDAIELLVAPRLAGAAVAGLRDFKEDRTQPVEPPGPHPLLLSQEAVEAYQRMKPRDRKELRVALVRGRAEEERLLWLRSRRWIVSFTYPDATALLVLAAFEVRALERELIGEEIWLARSRRALDRQLHGRDRATSPR